MSAIELIQAERQRQIDEEGWTPEHDDEHNTGELALAASAYALTPEIHKTSPGTFWKVWPWPRKWWKPSPDDRQRELVKAGALIVAEIERLQRVES